MARTDRLDLASIAAYDNVAAALHRAAQGKRRRPDVVTALARPERTVASLRTALLAGCLPHGTFRSFVIHDPKRRVIHAAPFLDRVAHHALVARMEPTFERVLIDHSYACRPGLGVHAAVRAAQRGFRRHRFVLHLDVDRYFPSIDHRVVLDQLRRRFRGNGLVLCEAVLDAHRDGPGRGLPIGALTSQHFANHYLNDADRLAQRHPAVGAYLRYMDDLLLFGDDAAALRAAADEIATFCSDALHLRLKRPRLQRTRIGLTFCGVRIRPFSLRPSLRRQRRYRRALSRWEAAWADGSIDGLGLQRAEDAIDAILQPATPGALRASRRTGSGVEP